MGAPYCASPISAGGLNLLLNFQKGGLDKTSTSREKGCWKRGNNFFSMRAAIFPKNIN